MHTNIAALPLLRAYIDETGDRGFRTTSSPYFGLCATVVPERSDPLLRDTVRQLRLDFGLTGRQVHWVEHLRRKNHDRRRHAAKRLAAVEDTQLVFALLHKANIRPDSVMRTDHAKMYNYALRLLFERLALLARDHDAGRHRVITKMGHVRGHDHHATLAYVRDKCPHTNDWGVPWELVTDNIEVAGMTSYDGLQAADLYCGMFNAAMTADIFGNLTPEYLLTCAHQIRRGPDGEVLNYGVKILGDPTAVTTQPWWSELTR